MLQSSSGLFTEVEEDQGDGDQDQAITRNRKIKHENNGRESCDNNFVLSET